MVRPHCYLQRRELGRFMRPRLLESETRSLLIPTCPPHLNDPLDELDLPALATKQKGKPVRKGPGLLCSIPGDAGWWPTHQGGACH